MKSTLLKPQMSGTLTDTETIRHIDAFKNGDARAFENLFEIYKDRVYSMAFHFCKSRNAAEDITQIVFLKLFRKLQGFRGTSEFSTWLYRIVINTCLDYHKRKSELVVLPEIPSDPAFYISASQEEEVLQKQINEFVRDAIARLKPRLRLPLLLRCIGGLSYSEIARILRLPEGTVASRINRAHAQMARALEPLKHLIR